MRHDVCRGSETYVGLEKLMQTSNILVHCCIRCVIFVSRVYGDRGAIQGIHDLGVRLLGMLIGYIFCSLASEQNELGRGWAIIAQSYPHRHRYSHFVLILSTKSDRKSISAKCIVGPGSTFAIECSSAHGLAVDDQ